jgi:hypothetical protein
MDDSQVPRDPNIIADQQDLVEALVREIVDGDVTTSQHIVDTLGDRAQRRR